MEKFINIPTTPQNLKLFGRKPPNIHIPQKYTFLREQISSS